MPLTAYSLALFYTILIHPWPWTQVSIKLLWSTVVLKQLYIMLNKAVKGAFKTILDQTQGCPDEASSNITENAIT